LNHILDSEALLAPLPNGRNNTVGVLEGVDVLDLV
jgi:hypothetical protein